MDKKEKKYTLIPDDLVEDYERFLKKEAEDKYEKILDDFDRKRQRFSDRRKEFLEDVSADIEIDHNEAIQKASKKRAREINEQIMDYCKDKGLKLCKTCQKGGKIKIIAQDNEGNIIKEELDLASLNNGTQQQ